MLPTLFGKRVLNASRKHAEKQFPRESVGVVYNGKYIPLTNTHADPENHFKVEISEVCKKADYDAIEGFIHSHNISISPETRKPLHYAGPSEADMEAQISWGIPFGIQLVNQDGAGNIIWWGDGVAKLPLEGRQYIFGVYDCYSIVRDYFLEKHDLKLGDYARDEFYWQSENAIDLYLNHIRDEGFEPVAKNDMREGDVILVTIRSKVVNHAIVYLGGDQGLHHPTTTISKVESINRYLDPEREFFHSVWRHKSLNGE